MKNEEYIKGILCCDCNDKDTCSETCYWYDHMKHVAEWKDEQFVQQKQVLIDKACEWLIDNLNDFIDTEETVDLIIDYFKKAMEETK